MNNTELKPCPFCGGKLEFIFLINIFKCRQCSARIEFPICKTDEERIKKVNTRKPMERIVEQLEERNELYKRMIQYEHKNGTITEEFQARKAVEVLSNAIEIVQKGGANEQKKNNDLVEFAKKAKLAGVTYGQQQAREYAENVTRNGIRNME